MKCTHKSTVAHAILRVLEEAGVEFIFGVPGGPLTGLFEALAERSRIRLVLAKHESGAAFMAAAYARVSGKLGVCVATSGPGATNSVTGIASAYSDSLPVLLLTGQVATSVFGRGAIQESNVFGVDVVSIFRPVTKLSAMATNAARIPELATRAVRTALSGRPGPVHLSLPADMLRTVVESRARLGLKIGLAPSAASGLLLDEAASVLTEARNPCILAGHGVALAWAQEELQSVADALGARVVTSPKGKGSIAENHELSLGVLGFGGHQGAQAFVESHMDVLLIVGSGMNEFVTNAWSIPFSPDAKIIQVDIDPIAIGKNYAVDVGIVGDARDVLAALGKRLTASRRTPVAPVSLPPQSLLPPSDDSGVLKPRKLVEDLREAMPDDAHLFVDNGSCILWATRYFTVRQPLTYHIDLGLASMGSAVAGVVGGALAAKPRRAVALVGDAAFAMHGFEVHTAVELKLPVVWVVLNDGGHGMVRHGDTLMHGKPLGVSDYERQIDVAKMAIALGARGERVTTPEEFRAAIKASLRADGPTVIDAQIDPTEIPPALIQRVQTLSGMFKAGAARSPLGG